MVQAQFKYTTNNGTITITDIIRGDIAYGGTLAIPATINGWPVTSIGNYAYLEGSLLTGTGITSPLPTVTIPNSITNIGVEVFVGWSDLTNIIVDTSNPAYSSLNGVWFDKAQATLIEFPFGLGGSYTIPNSVTSIATEAFYLCTSLTNLTIPGSVTNIATNVFYGCTNLTNIVVNASNPAYSSLKGVLFDKAQTTLILFPGSLGGSYTIPNSVTSIATEAFSDCPSLTSVIIPGSVTTIGPNVFYGCTSLTNIMVNATNPAYSSLKGVLFDKAQATLTAFPGGLGGSYTIPNSVTSIEAEAFSGCPSLTSVFIPNGVASIGDYAFRNCSGLRSAYFQGNAPPDDGTAFSLDYTTTVYHQYGTTGWGSKFGNVLAVLWNPQAQAPRLTAGHFGFNLTGPASVGIVVEACTNLSNPVWLPVATNTLSGSGTSTFSDPQSSSHPRRFYRFRSP
jgi:BspA type Leucine rich repeat region (6 copies)